MQDHRRLDVWHLADQLAVDVIRELTPARCRVVPGLRDQAIRSATSISDLISEGCGKTARLELARFGDMALGSAAELRNQIRRAWRVGILSDKTYARLDANIDQIRRMLTGLVKAIRKQQQPPSPEP